ncbi:MAG: anti-sigma factor [Planctomycetota bacterium]
MSAAFDRWDDELWDQATEALTQGLDAPGWRALEERVDPVEFEELEQTVAWVHLALANSGSPPASLRESLQTQASRFVAQELSTAPTAPVRQAPKPRLALAAWTGWLAAAALLCIWFWGNHAPETLDVNAWAAQAVDLQRLAWSATDNALANAAEGEVLWSADAQEGFMVFRGLPINDPKQAQYQLWMFDPARAEWEQHPVDGGVFDITQSGESVVPIHAKLPVGRAALFAVTLEAPGGVVVSQRENLLVLAKQES